MYYRLASVEVLPYMNFIAMNKGSGFRAVWSEIAYGLCTLVGLVSNVLEESISIVVIIHPLIMLGI